MVGAPLNFALGNLKRAVIFGAEATRRITRPVHLWPKSESREKAQRSRKDFTPPWDVPGWGNLLPSVL